MNDPTAFVAFWVGAASVALPLAFTYLVANGVPTPHIPQFVKEFFSHPEHPEQEEVITNYWQAFMYIINSDNPLFRAKQWIDTAKPLALNEGDYLQVMYMPATGPVIKLDAHNAIELTEELEIWFNLGAYREPIPADM